jgi:hypothetical protein
MHYVRLLQSCLNIYEFVEKDIEMLFEIKPSLYHAGKA